jgi:predicted SAM-dependent methyltransferase
MKRKLNVGCGRNPMKGKEWDNLDIMPGPGVNIVADIQTVRVLNKNKYDQIQMLHVIEHLTDPLKAMENLWHMAKPDALLYVVTPFGATDEAWADPTHVRPQYPKSFGYYGQHHYHFADYGYRGDWEVVEILLEVRDVFEGHEHLDVIIERSRNTCRNMHVALKAIKPARPVTTPQPHLKVGIKFVP